MKVLKNLNSKRDSLAATKFFSKNCTSTRAHSKGEFLPSFRLVCTEWGWRFGCVHKISLKFIKPGGMGWIEERGSVRYKGRIWHFALQAKSQFNHGAWLAVQNSRLLAAKYWLESFCSGIIGCAIAKLAHHYAWQVAQPLWLETFQIWCFRSIAHASSSVWNAMATWAWKATVDVATASHEISPTDWAAHRPASATPKGHRFPSQALAT